MENDPRKNRKNGSGAGDVEDASTCMLACHPKLIQNGLIDICLHLSLNFFQIDCQIFSCLTEASLGANHS